MDAVVQLYRTVRSLQKFTLLSVFQWYCKKGIIQKFLRKNWTKFETNTFLCWFIFSQIWQKSAQISCYDIVISKYLNNLNSIFFRYTECEA